MAISDWELAGVHSLRKYIWKLLQDELGWSAETYGGLVPITTPEQEPEFTNFNAPFLVYTYSKSSTSNLYALEAEVCAFTIYSGSSSDITKVINLLSAKLNKRDESAKELNDFVSTLDDRYKAFDFKTVVVSGSQGSQPVTQEGGRKDGYITVSMKYTHYGSDGLSIRF